MRKITLLALSVLISAFSFAATGWYEDFLTISVNGTSTPNNYFLSDATPASGATALNAKVFGLVSELSISGADMKYWADGGDVRTGAAFYYKITNEAATFEYIPTTEVIMDHASIGGNNYQGTKATTINLLAGLPYGTYKLHVWAKSWGDPGGDSYLSNSSNNYVSTFTKVPASGTPIAGTLKVGDVLDANFNSLGAAVMALKTYGVGGNVILEIATDITEPANIGFGLNTAGFNVTIRPNADVDRTLNFTQSTDNGASSGAIVFGLSNLASWSSLVSTSNITIDGYAVGGSTKRLTIATASTANVNATPIHIIGDVNNVTIKNCKLNINQTSGSAAFGAVAIRAGNWGSVDYLADDIVVDNCIINTNTPSGAGISTSNTTSNSGAVPTGRPTGLIFRNNTITVKHRAISLNYSGTCSIYNNEIRVNQTASGMASFAIGGTSAGLVTTNVYNNRIIQLATANTAGAGNGIRGIQASAGGTWNIYNNFITGFSTPATGTTEALGIRAGSTSNIYNNTIVLNNISTTGAGTSPIGCVVNYSATCNLANNILITQEDDIASYCIYQAGTLTSSDYNVLYRTGTVNAKIGFATSARATLGDWQSGSTKDTNSKSVNVNFVDAATGDLRIAAASYQDANLQVVRLADVPKDLFGTNRDYYTYAGAHQAETFIINGNTNPEEVSARIIRTMSGIEVQLDREASIELYTINGILLDKTRIEGTYARDLNNGIYIIRIDGKATKFVK